MPRYQNWSLHYLLEQSFFWIGSALCAGLYLKTICFVRSKKDSKNNRLKTLSKIFGAIAIGWLVCESPNVVMKIFEYPIWMWSNCSDSFFYECNEMYCDRVDIGIKLAFTGTQLLKILFPIVNTLLVLVLLRPLQKPLVFCFKFINRKEKEKPKKDYVKPTGSGRKKGIR